MELRSPDPSCNPYLAFALLLHAGLDGIEAGEKLPPASGKILFEKQENLKPALPHTLGEALELLRRSSFVQKYLPAHTLEQYLTEKDREWKEYTEAEDPQAFSVSRYFETV